MKKLLLVLCVIFTTASFADTETINWYVDDSLYNTTTCQTGGDITLQTAPAKRGHTFTGWEAALYDLSTLDYEIDGVSRTANPAEQTWSVIFPYGNIYGQSLCSKTLGSVGEGGNPSMSGNDSAEYCWCRTTGYKPVGSNMFYKPLYSVWVFFVDRTDSKDCASSCSVICGDLLKRLSAYRRSFFAVTQ